MAELIIAEKPAASLKIATALADDKVEKKSYKDVVYYEIKHKGKKIIIAAAVGHLYNLAEKIKNGWSYPVFDIEWKPSSAVTKSAAFTKKYVDTLKKICKGADEYTVACDYDLEGSLIGYNVIRFICGQKDAHRMKFSTLTKDELVESYEHESKHLDWPQIEAGETRHYADFYYGINLSRALTLSIKTTGRFAIMSTGRVQGPALKLIVGKELEIKNFKPVPYWQIQLLGNIKKNNIEAWHVKDKFWDKKEADKIIINTKNKEAFVSDIKKTRFKQAPPTPFDLTTLQLEAYRIFKINPKQTLEIAQNLYLAGLISYPRTSSQQLPESLNYAKILKNLSRQSKYSELCNELLRGKLKPNNGKKIDSAHPAIHPTGESGELSDRNAKIYDLIVKRALATFSTDAVRETVELNIDVNKEIFVLKGTRTVEEGWHKFYKPYVMLEEQTVPDVKKGGRVDVKEIKLHSKETQPPKRYTPASLVKELEKRNLGTKATRSEIIDTLYQRNYIKNESIEATELGIKIIQTLEKYVPELTSEKLTRHFEKDMDAIQEGKRREEQVLDDTKKVLTKILDKFKKKEKDIGRELIKATDITRKEMNFLGKCPACKEGNLRTLFSRKTNKKFVACDRYPDCKTTYSLPQGKIQTTKKVCQYCGTPVIKVIRAGKRPFEMCLTYNCKSKEGWNKNSN